MHCNTSSALQARLMAANGVQGLTGTPEGARLLLDHSAQLVPVLLKLVTDQAEVSSAALTSLVNLSQVLPAGDTRPAPPGILLTGAWLQEAAAAERLRQAKAIPRAMDYLRERATQHEGLLVMLLTNLTASEEGCRALLQLERPELQGLHV